MSAKRIPLGLKPAAEPAEVWVQQGRDESSMARKAHIYTARLTIDITPELRGRIKVRAFRRHTSISDMVREILEREFPQEAP